MRIVGVIAEYNPFHSGHAHQLRRAREAAHADAVVAVMSGCFVQQAISEAKLAVIVVFPTPPL